MDVALSLQAQLNARARRRYFKDELLRRQLAQLMHQRQLYKQHELKQQQEELAKQVCALRRLFCREQQPRKQSCQPATKPRPPCRRHASAAGATRLTPTET
jgi:hypothetical protein